LRLESEGPIAYSQSKFRNWQRPQTGCSRMHLLMLNMLLQELGSVLFGHTLVFLIRQFSHATVLCFLVGEGGSVTRVPVAGSNGRRLGVIGWFIAWHGILPNSVRGSQSEDQVGFALSKKTVVGT